MEKMGYGIVFRVWGYYALFTRPEMKAERMSYDVITPSAARGIIEAIYWKPAIRWVIDKIHVLNEIEFTNIRRNEVSEKIPEGIPKAILNGSKELFALSTNENRQQRAAMVLKNVNYIVEAHFEIIKERSGVDDTVEKHYNMVSRRLRKGQQYHSPCLGTREFGARIELIEERQIEPSKLIGKRDLGWMLYDMDFSDPKDIKPMFFRAEMINGVIDLTNVRMAR
jgi:CRISPR-associated protein Cas5d